MTRDVRRVGALACGGVGGLAGWHGRRYQNGCACGEAVEKDINYQGDIRQLSALGFDAVKFDGCGTQQNNTKYAALMKTTGKNFSVENCQFERAAK